MSTHRSETTSGEKILSLYTLLMLRGERVISLGELAEALSCSKQTVLRLLDQIEASGYGKLDTPIKKGREHFYRMLKNTNESLDIGQHDLSQIKLCRDILMNILPKGISNLLHENSTATSKPKKISTSFSKGFIDYTPFHKQYKLLVKAIQQEKVCTVSYKKNPIEDVRTFRFAPIRLVSYRESLSFLGWRVEDDLPVRPKYDRYNQLYLQRITDVKILRLSSKKLEKSVFKDEGTSQYNLGVMPGKSTFVQIHFSPETSAYVYDRIWGAHQKIHLRDDGSLLLEFEAQNSVELISWVLSFGANAEVLHPEWLRHEIKNEAYKIVRKLSTDAS